MKMSDLEDIKPDGNVSMLDLQDVTPYSYMDTWASKDVKPVIRREEELNVDVSKSDVDVMKPDGNTIVRDLQDVKSYPYMNISDSENEKPDDDISTSDLQDTKPYSYKNILASKHGKPPVVKREEPDSLEDEKPCIEALKASVLMSGARFCRTRESGTLLAADNREEDNDNRSLVTSHNTDEDYASLTSGLRVKLRPKATEVPAPVKQKPLTNAERAWLFRQRRAADPLQREKYLEEERRRSQMRRAAMSGERRQDYNAKAAVRNAKSRAKKKAAGQQCEAASTAPPRQSRWLEDLLLSMKREKERQRVQNYRDNMTPHKRQQVNAKRMERYYAVKEARQHNGLRVKLRPKATEVPAPVKKKPLTNAERAWLFRQRRAADPLQREKYLEEERRRSQMRRAALSGERRQDYNAKAAVRNAKSRAKKKDAGQQCEAASTAPPRQSRWLEDLLLSMKREKERQRVQNYRDNMTPHKRQQVNAKRMKRYYAVKEARQHNGDLRTREPEG